MVAESAAAAAVAARTRDGLERARDGDRGGGDDDRGPEPIENAVWVLLDELSITHARRRPLIERLEQDFSAAAGGYAQ